ncbi:MAG: DUF2807 domain-containing protein [Chitinophagaceae bacterium]|nr:DUF2807 domain-containing protein [Chitinophagaceae bacterium]
MYVKQDSVNSVRVESDENLLEFIIIENDNGTLDIHQKDGTNLKPSGSIKVYVSGPSFKHFEASGACDFYGENKITGIESVTTHLSGSSDVNMELKALRVDVDLSGAGTITLRGRYKGFQRTGFRQYRY